MVQVIKSGPVDPGRWRKDQAVQVRHCRDDWRAGTIRAYSPQAQAWWVADTLGRVLLYEQDDIRDLPAQGKVSP